MKKKILLTAILFLVMCSLQAKMWPLGVSSTLWKTPTTKDLIEARELGIEYIEIALNQAYRGVDPNMVPERIDYLKSIVDSAQIIVWSVHLPFSKKLDISLLDDSLRKQNVHFMSEMIRQAARFKPRYLVLHPSSEPIVDSLRHKRISCAITSIGILKQVAQNMEMELCIENLPRTCLGNTPEELLLLLQQHPDVGVCFDTNHYTQGTTQHFMSVVGERILTMHASDYDFMNECHWLPTQGNINWGVFQKTLKKYKYQGVFMYEVKTDKTTGRRVRCSQIVDTYIQLQKIKK